jgi:DNA-directed RNA polymerase subunit RPC12/RpoP
MMAAATKRCCRCGRTLPLDAFNRNRAKKDGLEYRCRECSRLDRLRRQAKRRAKRTAKAEHTEAEVRGLSAFLASLDLGEPHTATWWRQAARDGGFQWAGYGDVRAALSMAGIEPFDLRSRNLYAVADDYGRSGTRKTGRRKSTRPNGERHLRADESAPQGHCERKEGVQ